MLIESTVDKSYTWYAIISNMDIYMQVSELGFIGTHISICCLPINVLVTRIILDVSVYIVE